MRLSVKGSSISESLTLAIDAKAKKMKSEGMDVVGFGAGEPDFDTPSFIREAAKEALDRGMTRYTPVAGIAQLKEAICRKFKEDNGLDYKPNQIIVSNGAKHSLYNAFQAILNPGDEVIIPSPYWLSYPELVKLSDGVPVFVETREEDDFKLRPEDFKKAITSKTKALVLNSPNNPCGCVYDRNELEAIAEIAVENQIFVVSDEVYEAMVYDGAQHISIASLGPEIKDLTIVVNGVSKTYAMTGWRIGYAAAHEDVVKIMSNVQSHTTSNPNSIAQYASLAALTGPKDEVKAMVAEFDKRRRFMVERINSIPGLSCRTPKGAFYVMMNISEVIGKTYKGRRIEGSLSFADALLDAQMVAVVPGIAFGADNFVRLSYAVSLDNIKKGLDRIEAFIKELER
ncbi:aspartate aminotransferase [Caldicoprobacter guelmensis]|uniref:pyridoxal phosphate-dependent aminotransferase n=1 Tax=Caldicoprobacter guelmensis TaxID=1170224 RepID=UPI00195DAE29|nr:pyridoxal phosphate-dependent aminotransferase [Caldicoprobacter guelmensis]MBM7581455.1 aspartate aminotransferase [Caldicoprobacter guelmensis]